jgi:hypothetical protein
MIRGGKGRRIAAACSAVVAVSVVGASIVLRSGTEPERVDSGRIADEGAAEAPVGPALERPVLHHQPHPPDRGSSELQQLGALEAHELNERDSELFAEIERAVLAHSTDDVLHCLGQRNARMRVDHPGSPELADLGIVRFTPILRIAAADGAARVTELLDVRWPGDYDATFRACLTQAMHGIEYTTPGVYALSLALPVVIKEPGFQPPPGTDEGPW